MHSHAPPPATATNMIPPRRLLLAAALAAAAVSAAAKPPISSDVCASAIRVSGAGTNLVNGLYQPETSELSDGALYYLKWVAELQGGKGDWMLLFRDEDSSDKKKWWTFMTLAQINTFAASETYRDYYNIQSASATPPTSGWSGKVEDKTYSLGANPKPAFETVKLGGTWAAETDDCVRDCANTAVHGAAVQLPSFKDNCSIVELSNAGTSAVNRNFTFLSESSIDCVPMYMSVDSLGNVTYFMYRYWYLGRTYWVVQDDAQAANDTAFVEYYSVESNLTSPPAAGWAATLSLAASSEAVGANPPPESKIPSPCSGTEQTEQEEIWSWWKVRPIVQ